MQMAKAKKKRRSAKNESDDDYDFQLPNDEDSIDSFEANELIVTSSGRLVRPTIGTVKNANHRNVCQPEQSDKMQKDHSSLKRIKVYDMDRSYAPDLTKIARYLAAVRQTRINSMRQLAEEELKTSNAGGQTLLQFWRAKAIANSACFESCSRADFSGWKRVDALSSSLTRWLGKESIGLIVHGSVPPGIQGLCIESENEEIERRKERRPLPSKSPRKRGRPRKDQRSTRRLLATAFDERQRHAETSTANERLQSMVEEKIEAVSNSISSSKKQVNTRRTNNSMASSLLDCQKQPEQSPSTSTSAASNSKSKVEMRRKSSIGEPPLKVVKRAQIQISQKSKDSSFVTVKLEVEDFSLPAEFSHGINFPLPPRILDEGDTSQHNEPEQSTSSRRSRKSNAPKSNTSSTKTADSGEGDQQESQTANKIQNGASKPLTPTTPISKKPTKERKNQAGHGGVNLPFSADESQHIRIPLFGSRMFQCEIDQSPSVDRFESVQVIDIFDALLKSSESISAATTTYDSLCTHQNGNGNFMSPIIPYSQIERHQLLQHKQKNHIVQALFCGGPIAAVAVCPRALPNGRELFAVATFSDEVALDYSLPSVDPHSYLQFWTTTSQQTPINFSQTNGSASTSELAFLLRISDTPQVLSLAWCPNLVGAKDPLENTKATTALESEQLTPLGLLAVGTCNGRVHIFSIPSDLDAFLDTFKRSDENDNSSPLVLGSKPFLTLLHPLFMGWKSGKEEVVENKETIRKSTDNFPLFNVQWSPFDGASNIAAVSATWSVFVWRIFGGSSDSSLPLWSLPLDGLTSPPLSVGWMERDKICVTYRNRRLHLYKLLTPEKKEGDIQLIFDCDAPKSIGSFCHTRPLLFGGVVTFDTFGFNYLGNYQQAPCYVWPLHKEDGLKSKSDVIEMEKIAATNLSNCHQVRLMSAVVCSQSGICASVGADGRLCCSLNGRMSPLLGRPRETDNFIHGRTLLQLISHRKNEVAETDDDFLGQNVEKKAKFCYSHEECKEEKFLEVRLGDCALLDQKNERANGRTAPETCIDRRLEALSAVDFSHQTIGLTFCGGESGLLFITPCSL